MYELELVTYSSNTPESDLTQDEEQTTQFCGPATQNFRGVGEVGTDVNISLDGLEPDILDDSWENLDREQLEEWKVYLEQLKMNPAASSNKMQASSTFYIDLSEGDLHEKDDDDELEPDLLPGEHCIARAHRVISYSTVAGLTSGFNGSLFVTTMKLSMKLHVETLDQETRDNNILGPWDIPLTSIFAIYEISGDIGEKRKKLPLGSTVNTKIDAVLILCKNFRFHQFSFKFAKIDQGRSVVNALLHHVRPKKSNLLFAFEQKNNNYHPLSESSVPSSNWEKLLQESCCKDVRLTRANEGWQLCSNLPQQFIVPAHFSDDKLSRISGLFTGSRPPVWVWGLADSGGGLYIQAQLNVQSSLKATELRKEYYGVHMGRRIREVDLIKILPSQSLVEEAYPGMLDLYCLENGKDADKGDYFSKVEALGWQTYVSAVLRTAMDTCEMLHNGETAVIIDSDGRGASLLVASLAELILEPIFRSRTGFELLVQNNWVSLGYPFSAHNQICAPKSNSSLIPLFLVFLDCVHQMMLQFPSMFEFRTTYLVDLLDTTLLPIFDTFIFDTEHDRQLAHRNPDTPLNPSPAWNWQVQFSSDHIASWYNPLYGIPRRPVRTTSHDPSPTSQIMCRQVQPPVPENKSFLPVDYHISGLEIWTELFHRSVPLRHNRDHCARVLLQKQRQARTEVDISEAKNQIANNSQNSDIQLQVPSSQSRLQVPSPQSRLPASPQSRLPASPQGRLPPSSLSRPTPSPRTPRGPPPVRNESFLHSGGSSGVSGDRRGVRNLRDVMTGRNGATGAH